MALLWIPKWCKRNNIDTTLENNHETMRWIVVDCKHFTWKTNCGFRLPSQLCANCLWLWTIQRRHMSILTFVEVVNRVWRQDRNWEPFRSRKKRNVQWARYSCIWLNRSSAHKIYVHIGIHSDESWFEMVWYLDRIIIMITILIPLFKPIAPSIIHTETEK